MRDKPLTSLGVNTPSFLDKLWELFSSMKLGLILLGLIAVVAGLGTFFPQMDQDSVKAEAVAQIWQTLGFTHLYSTVWFRLLLGLLSVNLTVCSIQRFQGIYQRTTRPMPVWQFKGLNAIELFETRGLESGVKDVLGKTFKEAGYRVRLEERDGEWGFVAQKHPWGNWGSFLTHLAFVLLTVGALIGTLYGFKGYFMAGMGSTLNIREIEATRGSIHGDFSIRVNDAEDRFLSTGERDNWYTDLSILEQGKEVARQTLSVNHPFTYRGFTFYQFNYADGAQFMLNIKGEKIPVILQSQGGNVYRIPGTDLFLINAAMNRERSNPTIYYQVYRQPDFNKPVQEGEVTPGKTVNVQGTFDLTLDRYAGFTGLQVKKDPGIWVVWVGAGLLMVGLFLSFYWRPILIYGLWQTRNRGFLALAEAKRRGNGHSLEIERIADSFRGLKGGSVS